MSYEGKHILPESWWESLPPLAQAMWKKSYSEARDADDPAAIAWDRIREEFVFYGGEWLMKATLPGYQESADGTVRIWMGQDGDWVAPSIPPGSLDLPGNYRILKKEVEELPEEARKVYKEAYERVKRDSVADPHAIASNVVRAKFKKTKEGWVRRSPQEKQQDRRTRIMAYRDVQRPIWDEFFAEEATESIERISRAEYRELPENLRKVYRRAYRSALKVGCRSPVADAWKHILAKYERREDAWVKRSSQRESRVERLSGTS